MVVVDGQGVPLGDYLCSASPAEVKLVEKTLVSPFCDLLDIHQRNIPDPSLDTAVVRPMQPASLRSLFLIDLLFLANATDCAAKTDADIEGHRVRSWPSTADA